ncbi:MAG: winged helix DNA-binding domain-containing protein [Herpetosiphonaceae bacterium]|nr:winged helix DNA-binding domain-containing protein [Herpetosiphonaceae bacterium]
MSRVLTLRELNRATLARQLLLERASLPVPAAIERLAGLQAQQASAPYIGLWARLRDFRRDDLAQLIADRVIIKATSMRGTLHLMTAEDYLLLRATIQSALTSGFEAVTKGRAMGFTINDLLAVARDYIAAQPRTFAEISTMLSEWMPAADLGALRYGVRTHLPLVQVPVSSGWSYPGNPQWTLAETWLDQPVPTEQHLGSLIVRYLAAFGPASVTDIQTWSGLPKLKDAVAEAGLCTYRDEQGRALFDLPDLPIPAPDTPAPVRFLPEYDNLLLSHAKRTRVVADVHRPKVFLPGLRVAATILVDGFVRGAWKIEKTKSMATLVIEPFEPLTPQQREELTTEGERLLQFVEPDARAHEVRFAD